MLEEERSEGSREKRFKTGEKNGEEGGEDDLHQQEMTGKKKRPTTREEGPEIIEIIQI